MNIIRDSKVRFLSGFHTEVSFFYRATMPLTFRPSRSRCTKRHVLLHVSNTQKNSQRKKLWEDFCVGASCQSPQRRRVPGGRIRGPLLTPRRGHRPFNHTLPSRPSGNRSLPLVKVSPTKMLRGWPPCSRTGKVKTLQTESMKPFSNWKRKSEHLHLGCDISGAGSCSWVSEGERGRV